MSAAAPSSPAVVRNSSSSRRSIDRPHRSQSQSQTTASRAPPASRHQSGGLPNVARRDYEQSNVAHEQPSPQPSRRSEDPGRTEATRRSHARYASDASTTSAMPVNGVAAEARPGQPQPVNKRRTTITAPSTGTWALGKTIGAGSMGKVKLAKNAETGEQVCTLVVYMRGMQLYNRSRVKIKESVNVNRPPSRSFRDSPRTSIRAPPTANEPTTPKKSELPERLPLSVC